MKRFLWILALAGCATSQRTEWKDLPIGGATVKIESNGRVTDYTPVGRGKQVSFDVSGPGEFRLYARLVLPPGQKEKLAYAIDVAVNSGVPKRKSFQATPDPDAHPLGTKETVGDRDSTDLTLPAGSHRIQVTYASGPPGPLLLMLRRR